MYIILRLLYVEDRTILFRWSDIMDIFRGRFNKSNKFNRDTLYLITLGVVLNYLFI